MKDYLNELPQGASVAIYGAGESGQKVKWITEFLRPDIKIVAFLDSYKSGEFAGLPCVRIAEYSGISSRVDYICIASMYCKEIEAVLKGEGLFNYVIAGNYYCKMDISCKSDLANMGDLFRQREARVGIPQVNSLDKYIAEAKRDLDRLSAAQEDGFMPMNVMVQISKKCNLRCIFCGHETWKGNSGFMDFSLFEKIVDEMEHYGGVITLVGPQGEPTLHPRFSEMLDLIGSRNVQALLCTNGTALTKAKIKAIVRNNIRHVKISFAGYDKDSYERTFVGGNFEKVVRNIKMLSDEIKVSGSNVEFSIAGLFIHFETGKDSYESFSKKCYEFYNSLDLVGGQTVTDHAHNFAGKVETGPQDKESGIYSLKKAVNGRRPFCEHLLNPCIHYDGRVSSCGCLDANCDMQIGDYNKNSLVEIMQGSVLQKMLMAYLERDYSVLPMCRKCDVPFGW